MEEINLLRLEGTLFCFDPREAKRRRGTLTLARVAEEALHPRSPAASRQDVAEMVWELLDEQLAPLVETVDRATRGCGGGRGVPGL